MNRELGESNLSQPVMYFNLLQMDHLHTRPYLNVSEGLAAGLLPRAEVNTVIDLDVGLEWPMAPAGYRVFQGEAHNLAQQSKQVRYERSWSWNLQPIMQVQELAKEIR